MACWWNHNLTMQQVDEKASWLNLKLMKWEVDEIVIVEMACCWNEKLFQLQVDELASRWVG